MCFYILLKLNEIKWDIEVGNNSPFSNNNMSKSTGGSSFKETQSTASTSVQLFAFFFIAFLSTLAVFGWSLQAIFVVCCLLVAIENRKMESARTSLTARTLNQHICGRGSS